MTERHAAYLVTLRDDIREEGSARVMDALRLIKGVVSVAPIEADHRLQIAIDRYRMGWADDLRKAVKDLCVKKGMGDWL